MGKPGAFRLVLALVEKVVHFHFCLFGRKPSAPYQSPQLLFSPRGALIKGQEKGLEGFPLDTMVEYDD